MHDLVASTFTQQPSATLAWSASKHFNYLIWNCYCTAAWLTIQLQKCEIISAIISITANFKMLVKIFSRENFPLYDSRAKVACKTSPT